jgi:hypothetical protein
MSSDLPIKKVHTPTASQLEKLQKKQTKKFEKASARQLYKNISKGTVDKREMETKSFGKRSIEDLMGKVTAKEVKISIKEGKQFKATKKVVHAFQRVKNWMLAGEFENNMKLLQMAKAKLPTSENPVEPPKEPESSPKAEDKPPPPEPVKEEPVAKLVEAEPVNEEPVPEPAKEEPVVEPVKEEPIPEPAKAEPKKKVVKVIHKRKITHKESVIKSINELAFHESADVSTLLTRGTAMITRTDTAGVYKIHYRKDDDTVVTATLKVIDAQQMFLQYDHEKPISRTSLNKVLETFRNRHPGPLIAPPLKEGDPIRKFVPQQAE